MNIRHIHDAYMDGDYSGDKHPRRFTVLDKDGFWWMDTNNAETATAEAGRVGGTIKPCDGKDKYRGVEVRVARCDFQQYRRKQIAELRPWTPGDDMSWISVSKADKEAGSPKPGDMIARNPENHEDQWLVSAKYFADNFEPAA